MNIALIAGVDEVGRGAWAGPIVAAAVVLGEEIEGLKDSKKLSLKRRNELTIIIKNSAIAWSIAQIEAAEIDEIGLGEANKRVMRMAIAGLGVRPCKVLCDGFCCGSDIEEEAIIHGDDLCPQISAASIIAKVYRDNLMHELHLKDARFGYDKHVGYGTKLHREMLEIHGVSENHRTSFKPLRGSEQRTENKDQRTVSSEQ
jgi:ribonuclease HII